MFAKSVLYVVLLCLSALIECSAYRILGVFPMGARSHYFLGNSLMKGLAEAGHDVTFISPFSDKNPPKNGTFTEIVLDDLEEFVQKTMQHFQVKTKIFAVNPIQMIFMLNHMTLALTEKTLSHPKVQELMNSGQKFDAVIVTELMCHALKGLANHFDAHLMLFGNHGGISWFHAFVGIPALPSFFPELISSFPPKMSFYQRLQNTLLKIAITLNEHFVVQPYQKELARRFFPNGPELEDILYNVSLVLVNSHSSTNNPQPKVPCVVDIGGFHIKPPKKLPSDLQKYLDDATEGVIYFSMGSHFKCEELPAEKIGAMLKAFSKRKEKILWKWGQDSLPGLPDNVKLGKWFPQQEILAHPNVKLFITHSGFLSTTETIYHGVPIVSVPLAGDQKLNAISASQDGYGVVVFIEDMSAEVFGRALEEVISNEKYTKIVKEKSRIMHDRQMRPIDEAVYWVKYVIRHNGAKHLRVAYLDLAWYQFYLFDVFIFLIISMLLIIYVLKKLISLVFRLIRNLRKTKLKKS